MKKVLAKRWLFLANLIVNKNIKSERIFCRHSVSSYFETFQCFTKFSFPHKRNDGRLLLINVVLWVASRIAEQTKTWDLRKLVNIRKVS